MSVPFQFDETTGTYWRVISNEYSNYDDLENQSLGRGRKSPTKDKILRLLIDDPTLTVPQLARMLDIKPSGIYRIVIRLKAEGAVDLSVSESIKDKIIAYYSQHPRASRKAVAAALGLKLGTVQMVLWRYNKWKKELS